MTGVRRLGARIRLDDGNSSAPVSAPRRRRGSRSHRIRRSRARGSAPRPVILAGFLAVLYFLQDRMIFPGAATQGTPRPWSRPRARDRAGPACDAARRDAWSALFGPALSPDGKPASRRRVAAGAPLLLRQRDVPGLRRARIRAVPPAGPERADSRLPRLRDERRQAVRGRMPARRPRHASSRSDRGASRPRGSSPAAGRSAARWRSTWPRAPLAGLIAFSTFTSTHEMALAIVPLALPAASSPTGSTAWRRSARSPARSCSATAARSLVPFPMLERLAAAARRP